MPTCSLSITTITRVAATLLITATLVAACDEAPGQGIIGDSPEPRLLDIGGDLAIYEVELDGETRRVEVLVPSDGQAFRILDGDRIALEVVDGTTEAVSDPITEAVAEFVLDGGLMELADDFRSGCRTCEIATDT